MRLRVKTDLLVSLLLCQIMSRTSETTPWKDGYWQTKIPDVPGSDIICVVKGSDVSIKCGELNDVMGKWAFGKFEMASKKLKKKTGMSETNIRMVYDLGHLGGGTQVFHGILTKSGTKCYMQYPSEIRKYQWLDEDDIKRISDSVEHINDKLPNLVDRRSRIRPVPKLGEPPLPVGIPKNMHINVPSRARYNYKPPHLLPMFTNTERLKYLETKLAMEQLEENPGLPATLLRKR